MKVGMVIAVLCITMLGITALATGIDGAVLAATVGAITAIVTGSTTYTIGKTKGYKAGKEENSPPASYEE